MIKLEVIERDVVSGSEVLHWVTHFPVSIVPLVLLDRRPPMRQSLILPSPLL